MFNTYIYSLLTVSDSSSMYFAILMNTFQSSAFNFNSDTDILSSHCCTAIVCG